MSLTSRLLGLRSTGVDSDGSRAAQVGTQTLTYTSPGAPVQAQWDAASAVAVGYLGHIYSYRCARTIAQTIAGLPFRAGLNPNTPGAYDVAAPLAQLLGPAPHGPAPQISPRQFWLWTVLQYLITGRWAWETELSVGTGRVLNLWPLPARYVQPIMSSQPGRWWDGYRVQAPNRQVDLQLDQAFYAWRPSQDNWREPESMLQAAAHTVSIGVAMDRFMSAFMRNNMVGSKLIVTPPFDEGGMRRAFQDQFLAEMTSPENAGRTAFAEWDDDGTGGANGQKPNVQVVDLASKFTDAQFIEMKREIKTDICVAWGVPVSMLGNASERTYENADQEHRNYWTGTILPLVLELADHVNIGLAPRLGKHVGWFDLSDVHALQPPRAFSQDTPTNLVAAGIITVDEVREDLGLAPRDPNTPEPTEILPGVDDSPGAGGKSNFGGGRAVDDVAFRVLEAVAQARAGRVGDRKTAALTGKVLAYLQQNYPDRVLGWVKDADWRLEPAVPLDRIKMARRPGGRDLPKVAAIADAVRGGKAMEPVVLVDTGGGQLEVADGYHRTLAFFKAGRKTIRAYVASGVGEHGPWETAMHDAKLNRAAGERDGLTEGSSAGALLPVGQPKAPIPQQAHLPVRGAVRGTCGRCGQPVRAKIHRTAMNGNRHGGPGHHPVPTGHVNTHTRRRAALVKATTRHAELLEPELAATMRQVFEDQAKATVDRLNGRRGKQMLRAARPPAASSGAGEGERDDPTDPVGHSQVDLAQIFDRAFWTARTARAISPLYAAVASVTPDRVHAGLGSDANPTAAALSEIRGVLDARSLRLAGQVTTTTADQLAETLNEGVELGEGIPALADRVRSVFDDATQTRAETIARTEVLGAMHTAAQAFAEALPADVVAQKQWVATEDARTRETHAEVDGQVQPVDGAFDVGGVSMLYPGDPDAPAEEVINCRCTAVYLPAEQTGDATDAETIDQAA